MSNLPEHVQQYFADLALLLPPANGDARVETGLEAFRRIRLHLENSEEVLRKLDFQAIGRAPGLRLGDDVAASILAGIQHLNDLVNSIGSVGDKQMLHLRINIVASLVSDASRDNMSATIEMHQKYADGRIQFDMLQDFVHKLHDANTLERHFETADAIINYALKNPLTTK